MVIEYKVRSISEQKEGFFMELSPTPLDGETRLPSVFDDIRVKSKERPQFSIGQEVTVTIS